LTKCIGGFDGYPLSWQVSMLSLTYNIGTGAACSSTAARRAISGDLEGSCQAMTWFNKAGGKVVKGLKLRREMGDANRIGELELCLSGLDAPVIAAPKPTDTPVTAPEHPKDADNGSQGTIIGLGIFLALVAGIAALVIARRRKGK